ncbi:MAG TPA: pilus assembly protein PilM [Pseudogracilibacillus sp.]|nr:pilus assembly protein PilM [Pseudogracilibacillus sp.]
MFSFGKSKRIVNIVINDYVIRAIESNNGLSSIHAVYEKPLPINTIENGKIVDEIGFFEFIQEIVAEWGIKNRNVRFYAPEPLVIMRDIDIPENVAEDEVKQYITMEIGNTIHFPFTNPVFDLYDVENKRGKITVLAAPEEEIIKYTEVFVDAKLQPIAVDIQPLGIYRYFLHTKGLPKRDEAYMFLELSLTSLSMSIFHQHKLEFLRYQPLSISANDWQPQESEQLTWTYTGDESRLETDINDQLNEIERVMNFYRFSLHQGARTITNIVLLGDYPKLQQLQSYIDERYDVKTTMLHIIENDIQHINTSFIPALGLALKGGK